MNPENEWATGSQFTEMSEFSRITGVLFEPEKTFTEIARRPSWIVPLILLILTGIGGTFVIGQRIGWERILRQQDEANTRLQQMPKEQQEQTLAVQMKFASAIGYAGGVLGAPIYCLVVAAVLLGITALMSAGLRFNQVFAIVTYGSLPRVISGILMIIVAFLKNPDDFNIRNPLAFNVGAFMDPNTSSKFVYSLASSLDLFSIWTILLLAIGLKAAAGKRLSFAGALVAVVAPWAVVVLGIAALAGAFS